ncbi:MAG: thiamine pyrophosphate-dependent enzyme [Sphingomonadales bacterium]
MNQPIWCAGCGHFGVQGALSHALKTLEIPPFETIVLAGIGCSGTVQNNLGTYGYHAMHGRVLPTAIGTALANPALTVIASGGDGDGYAIGAGHFVHTLKRNPSLVYIVMNNGTYGLTKGQDSPTKDGPSWAPDEDALDAIMLGLSIGSSTFLARGYAGAPDQLNDLTVKALEHARAGKGFAFLEVLSPCVTYNDTYPLWESMVHDIGAEPDYDAGDRSLAFATCMRLKDSGRIPTGLIYEGDHPTLEKALLQEDARPMAQIDGDVSPYRDKLEAILASCRI